ncbi:MAG: vWA domain-containing protein [Fimbriimonadaceae bacterium]
MNSPFDPNQTRLGGAPIDPVRTQMNPGQPAPFMPLGPDPANMPASLKVDVFASREATMANGPAREQFLVEVSAPDFLPKGAVGRMKTPTNVILVLDVSQSMTGNPIESMKEAACYVVDLLSPDDLLGIVTFSQQAFVLMPVQKVVDKNAIKSGIRQLQPEWTTNVSDGLMRAHEQAMLGRELNRASRILLFTDGEPTDGLTDFPALVDLAGTVKDQGVGISLLGFGQDYNEELLVSMARRGGGNFYHISRTDLMAEVFRAELEKLTNVVATDLRLEVKPARWVETRGNSQGDTFSIDLPDLERGALVDKLVEFEFQNHPLGWYRVAEGTLRYNDTISGRQEQVAIDFIMEFTADRARYEAPQNPKVASMIEYNLASEKVERTIMGLRNQQITTGEALSDLERTQAILTKDGRFDEASEVTRAIQAIKAGDVGEAQKTLMGAQYRMEQGKKQL